MSAVSGIPLVMSGKTVGALSPPFCGKHILWRADTGQLNSLRRNGKCWGRLLASCYEPIFSTGKCDVLYSGFCVSKIITSLLGFGVYSAVLIKKRKYWPIGVLGNSIDQYFSDKDVTHVDLLEAMTEEDPDDKAFKIFFRGAGVCHEDYGHLDDTGRVGRSKELDGAGTMQEYKGWDGQSLSSIFNYCQSFCLHFC